MCTGSSPIDDCLSLAAMSFKLLQVIASVEAAHGEVGSPESVSVPQEAVTVVKGLPRRPLNLITIWGQARTGKSFFLNALARNDALFSVSGSMQPCTVGADMSKTVCDISGILERMKTEPSSSSASSPVIGFVDVEGQGDNHLEYDTLLALPLLLLSKVIIFNWQGLPNKTTMLESLACAREVANAVEEDQRSNAFGHLVVLLRDTEEKEEDARRIIFDSEEFEGAGGQETQEANEHRLARNATRDHLKQSFESIKVFCMPIPHDDIEDSVIGHNGVDESFATKMTEIREYIAGIVQEPHRFGGAPVEGGEVFLSLLQEVCKAVNGRVKDILPPRMVEVIQQRQGEALIEETLQDFKKIVETLEGEPRTSMSALEDGIEKSRSAVLDKFADKTRDLSDKIVSVAKEKLQEKMSEMSDVCRGRHQKKVGNAKARVIQMADEHRESIDDSEEMGSIMSRLPFESEEELCPYWENLCKGVYFKFLEKTREEISEGLQLDVASCIPRVEDFLQSLEGKLSNLTEKNKIVKDSKEHRDADLKQAEEQQRQQEAEHGEKMAEIQERYRHIDREELHNSTMEVEGERDRLKKELEERTRRVRDP